MLFVRPSWLWLLLILVPMLIIEWRARGRVASWQPYAALPARLAGIAILILALARPVLLRADRSTAVVVAVDVSDSMSDSELARIRSQISIMRQAESSSLFKCLVFDSYAREIAWDRDKPAPDFVVLRREWRGRDTAGGRGSSIAGGLELAGALLHGHHGRIVLFSDGLETSGNACTAAHRLGERGIRIEVRPSGGCDVNEVALRSVELPPTADMGASVDLAVEIESTVAGSAQLRVLQAGALKASHAVGLRVGRQILHESLACEQEGLQTYAVEVICTSDTDRDNNQLAAAIYVHPPRHVVVLEEASERRISAALSLALGSSAIVQSVAAAGIDDLLNKRDCDLLVIGDVPGDSIQPTGQRAIVSAVIQGMGLLATGGPHAFGYATDPRSPLVSVLPVRIRQDAEQRDPSTALVIIIDTSGSMGGPRVSMAKEIARLALNRLSPHDKAGIVEFYGAKRWAAPIQPASNAIDLHRALNRLTASGGTVILPAIEEAYYALKNVRTRSRHVLVLTDGGVETGPFEPLVRRMADDGIVLSTVMTGPGAHSSFLASLAQWGGGRFYAAPDRFNLPEIMLKDPESTPLNAVIKAPWRLVRMDALPFMSTTDFASAPSLNAYVRTELRPTADLLLASQQGDPVLARWRYGLGACAVFTSQFDSEWLGGAGRWPGLSVMALELSRSLYGPRANDALRIRCSHHAGMSHINIEDSLPQAANASAPIEVTIDDPADNVRHQFTLDPILPHRWSHVEPNLRPGVHVLRARTFDNHKHGAAACVIPTERELPALSVDVERLHRLATITSAAAAKRSNSAAHTVELAGILTGVSLVLLLVQVLLRRLPITASHESQRGTTRRIFILCLYLAGQCPVQAARADGSASAPTEPASLFAAARQQESQGNTTDAIETLQQSLNQSLTSVDRMQAAMRLSLLQYDRRDATGAAATLATLVERTQGDLPSIADCAAQIASLCKDDRTAASLLSTPATSENPFRAHCFRGLYLLRSGNALGAAAEYREALVHAVAPGDRRFALERIVAASRRAGRLDELANEWLRAAYTSPEQLPALVILLRELGRSGDVLHMLQDKTRAVPWTLALHREAIAAAIASGRTADAEGVYLDLIDQQPDRLDLRCDLARLYIMGDERDKAQQLFDVAAQQHSNPASLLSLADEAARFGFQEQAAKLAQQAGNGDKLDRARAARFEANLLRDQGKSELAAKTLISAAQELRDSAPAVQIIADAFERMGRKTEAVELYRQLVKDTGSEDLMLRLAWLFEQTNRTEDAVAAWKRIWEMSQVPARQKQAGERLLDLAAKVGMLADLAIELEERVDRNAACERELSLLIELYTAAGDSVSAAEILHEYAARSGRAVDALNRLVRVYLGCEQFGRCNAVLNTLGEIDPANAADYLQQMAILAVDRKRPHDARKALSRLDAIAGDEDRSDEIAAGVLDMLGLHKEAAGRYERLLQAHPGRIESLLLWGNAMKASGRSDEAVQRFQQIVDLATEDDLFAVGIDGLLNMQADAQILRWALRRVYIQIATNPGKVFLYQLAGDLLEALNERSQADRVLEQAVIVAAERRGSIVRELMDAARDHGKVDEQIRWGQSLLMLGDEYPPQVYLDLGEALIRNGAVAAAEQVFERAEVESDGAALQLRMASSYEDACLPAEASRVLRQLLAVHREDPQVLVRYAAVNEQLGEFDAACNAYGKALQLLIQHQPVQMKDASVPVASATDRRNAARTPGQAKNVNEMTQWFEPAIEGLLGSARSAEQRTLVMQMLSGMWAKELKGVLDSKEPTSSIAAYPRLTHLSDALRRAAVSFRLLDTADENDRKLLVTFPRDSALRKDIVELRLQWGLTKRVGNLVESRDDACPPHWRALLLANACKSGEVSPITSSGISTLVAARLVPTLVLLGRDDDAVRLLSNPWTITDDKSCDAVLPLVTAAVALGNADLTNRTIENALACCGRIRDGQQMARFVEGTVRRVWASLSPSDRKILVERIGQLAAGLDENRRTAIDVLCYRLKVLADLPRGDIGSVANCLFKDKSISTTMQAALLADMLAHLPAGDQAKLVSNTCGAYKPAEQRSLLLGLAGRIRVELAPECSDAIVKMLAASQVGSKSAATPAMYAMMDWNRNTLAPELGHRIGEYFLSASLDDPFTLAAVAVARETAGKHDGATSLVTQAIEAVLAVPAPKFQHARLLDDISCVLRDSEIEAILSDLRERADIEGATPMSLLACGILSQAASMGTQACRALQLAFETTPSNRVIGRTLISTMYDENRLADLASVLSANLSTSTMMESFKWHTLAEVQLELGDPVACMRAAARDQTPLAPVNRIRAAVQMKAPDQILLLLRQFMTHSRESRRLFTPFWEPMQRSGGMLEYLAKHEADNKARLRLFEALADQPFAEREYAAALQGTMPDQPNVAGLIAGLGRAVTIAGASRRELDRLSDLQQGNALTVNDRQLLLILLEQDACLGREAADTLEPLLDDVACHVDPSDMTALDRLARAYASIGAPTKSSRVQHWVDANTAILANLDRDDPSDMDQLRRLLAAPMTPEQIERAMVLVAHIVATDGQVDASVLLGDVPPDDATARGVGFAAVINAAREQRRISRAAATRTFALLAVWYANAGMLADGRAAFTRGREIAGELGGHWLWLADAARVLGDEPTAWHIEQDLHHRKMLPPSRLHEWSASRPVNSVRASRNMADSQPKK